MGLALLTTRAFQGEDLADLGRNRLEYASRNPGAPSADALMDAAVILQIKGFPRIGLAFQQQALETKQIYRLPAKHEPAIRLLALKFPGPISANTPLEFLVESSDIELTMLYLSPELSLPESLPDHDVMFVAIGHSAESQSTLDYVSGAVSIWPRPVLNSPERIAILSRDTVSVLLACAPGIVMPQAERVSRCNLEQLSQGDGSSDFPVLIRPVDSHAGIDLIKADERYAITEYLQGVSAEEFYVTPFVDYRSKDGLFRKYRVVLIDGAPYAGHMALSTDWMIHYLNGGMEASHEKRFEEEQFITRFDEDFAVRHHDALREIADRVALDYLIIDCAETREGQLLIFEVDSSAVIHAMDPIDVFPYKRPQFQKIAAAFRDMLLKAMYRGREF